MKQVKLLIIVAIILLASATMCACSTQTSPPEPAAEKEPGATTVIITITQDFGRELMLGETLEVSPDTSAMAALMEVAEVETAYGGGFVNAINGVRSGYAGSQKAKKDWFFYINGIQSNVGALDYKLHDGDVQHWDFHSWGFRHFIPAIIDDFPSAFRYGFGGRVSPTLIVCPDYLKQDVVRLEEKLAQLEVKDVGVRSIDELAESEQGNSNIILVSVSGNRLFSELNQNWQRLGFFAYFENGDLIVINNDGEITAEYGAGTGLIQATQNPWNPKGVGACENVVWLVSGTDEVGVENALDALIDHHSKFHYSGAVVVADGQIIKVPR
jgi:hypothetical protein